MEWATASDTEASSLEGLNIRPDLFGNVTRKEHDCTHAEGISVTGLLLGRRSLIAFRVSILSDTSLVPFFAASLVLFSGASLMLFFAPPLSFSLAP